MAQEQIGEIAQLLKLHIESSNKNHDKTFAKLEEQDKQLQAILLQAQKTNGRVLSLEETRKENEKKFELVDSLVWMVYTLHSEYEKTKTYHKIKTKAFYEKEERL